MAETNDTRGATGGTGSNEPKPQPVPSKGGLAQRLAEVVTSVLPQEKKSPVGGSAPEPVILEEHIVEKPPQSASAKDLVEDVGLKLPTPSPEVSISLKPRPLTIPPTTTQPAEAPVAPPRATEAPHIEKLAPVIPTPPEIPRTIEEAAAITPPSGDITTDIQKILSQVKLPERRDFKGTADPKPAASEVSAIPKNLQGMVTKPPDEETAHAMSAKLEAAPISSVHTLKDDLQHMVKEKKMSLVRAVSLEQDKKRDEFVEEEFGRKDRRRRVTGILFATFLLFGLGAAALSGVYFVIVSHAGSEVQSQNSIVFAEQSVALPLDNSTPSELKRRVASARQTQTGSLGSITRIVPLIQGADPKVPPIPATTAQFFSAMGFNAPDALIRSLDDAFFFGLHTVDKNAPVVVIPVTNYDRAFAGMLAWEATMNADLAPTFTPVAATILDVNGIPSARVFTDDVMRNYDVRELKDDTGTVELYYSFPSKNLLIIAESPYSFPELLSRLQSVRKL